MQKIEYKYNIGDLVFVKTDVGVVVGKVIGLSNVRCDSIPYLVGVMTSATTEEGAEFEDIENVYVDGPTYDIDYKLLCAYNYFLWLGEDELHEEFDW